MPLQSHTFRRNTAAAFRTLPDGLWPPQRQMQPVQATLILTRRTKGTSLSGLASYQAGHDQTVVHLWRSPSPATRRRSTAEPRWLRELAENEELTVRRLACGGHAECMMRALGNSVLRERVMGSSRQGQQLLCHGQQPVRGNSLSAATACMSWATACQGQHPVSGNSLYVMGNSLSGATACQGRQLLCHGLQPVRGNSLSGATAYQQPVRGNSLLGATACQGRAYGQEAQPGGTARRTDATA